MFVDFDAPEQRELVTRAKTEPVARARLVLLARPLMMGVVNKIWGRRRGREDAEQEACIGFLRAVDIYDAARGGKFAMFAGWHIAKALYAHDAFSSLVYLGTAGRGAMRVAWAIRRGESLENKNPRTVAAVQRALHVSHGHGNRLASLEYVSEFTGGAADSSRVVDRAVDIRRLIERVPGGQLVRETLAGKTVIDVAAASGRSRQAIDREWQRAVKKMRKHLGVEGVSGRGRAVAR